VQHAVSRYARRPERRLHIGGPAATHRRIQIEGATVKKQDIQDQPERILSRRLARELTKDQLSQIIGGANSSSRHSSTVDGEGDDGGADD
jgi:bacteriocin-like protein